MMTKNQKKNRERENKQWDQLIFCKVKFISQYKNIEIDGIQFLISSFLDQSVLLQWKNKKWW